MATPDSSSSAADSPLRLELARIIALLACMVVAHAPALTAGFVNWDDNRFVADNPRFHGPILHYITSALTEVQFEAYQPLHLLAYLPDRLLWPTWAPGFHALNLLIFGSATILLYRLARRHAPPWAAWAASLMFALHPLCVEPVAWITGRKDVTALLLAVAALLCEDQDRGSRRRPSVWGLILFAAALLTKTASAAMAPVVFAQLRWLRGLPLAHALARTAPYALLGAVALAGSHALWQEHDLIIARPLPAALDVPATIGFYIVKILVPIDLAALYPPVPALPWLLAGLALVPGIIVLLAWRRLPGAARFAAFAVLGALVPVANIVPLYFRFADRYALFALAALVVPAAIAMTQLMAKTGNRRALQRNIAMLALAVLALALAASSFLLTRTWRDSQSLWQRAASAHPDSYFAHLKLGETLRDAGRWDAAAGAYQDAIRLDPRRPLAYAGLLYSYAREDESAGRIPAGTADSWLRELGPAMVDPLAFRQLERTVAVTGCARCVRLLVLLGVRSFTESDDIRLAQAEAALDQDAADLALIYLSAVRDTQSPHYRELSARARAAYGQSAISGQSR